MHSSSAHDRGREGLTPPRPPNRTGGFPAYGSPVGSFFIESVSQSARPCKASNPACAKEALTHVSAPTISSDAVTSADTMRTVQIKASTLYQARASAPCVALAGIDGAFCASFRSIPHPPSYPAFPRCGFALRTFRGSSPLRYYAGSDSCRASHNATGLSGPSVGLLDIQSPTTSCAQTSRAYHLVRPVGSFQSQASPIPLGGSPLHTAESGSCSYRLSIRLQLLPTPPRSDATIPPLERRSCFRLHMR